MKREYITHFERWTNRTLVARGNHTASATGQVTSKEFLNHVREEAAKECGCPIDQILIVGVFRL